MTNRIVLAYFGDQESTASIAALAADHHADVVAVAFDFGDGTSLASLRHGALTAGATRCHALDVREEFAREVVIPALRANVFSEPASTVNTMTTDFVARKLREVASIEQAAVIVPERVPPQMAARRRVLADVPAYVQIRFDDGVPQAVNGVPMTVSELMESLETITGAEAIDVLAMAYSDLAHAHDGHVALLVENGACTVAASAVSL